MLYNFLQNLTKIIIADEEERWFEPSSWSREDNQIWANYFLKELQKQYPTLKDTSRGVEKITFVFSSFVIKVFLFDGDNDYDIEYDNYQMATERLVSHFFPKTYKSIAYKYKDFEVGGYIQEKCTGIALDDNREFSDKCYTNIQSNEELEAYADNLSGSFDSSADYLIPILISFYDENEIEDLRDFLNDFDINDLHSHNFFVNPKKKTVKIFDFSGYC